MRARRPNPGCSADAARPDAPPTPPTPPASQASPAGTRARARFATLEHAPQQPAAGGAIAVSVAIVAFRNWPRRGL
ncbi:MAG: hypothetical protein V4764_11880 [Burkholderia sp.]